MQSVLSVDPRTAAADLDLVAQARRSSRNASAGVWFPLLVGGVMTLAAPTVIDVIGTEAAPGWYWGFGGPAIGFACAAYYSSRRVQAPMARSVSSIVVAIAMVGTAMGVGALTGGRLQEVGPLFAVSCGLGLFAWLMRSGLVLTVAAAHLAAVVSLLLWESDDVGRLASVICGALSCAMAGVDVLKSERRQVML